jgi:hypothetical protein
VAKRALKTVIATEDFNIGIANARQAHADQRPVGPQSGQRFLHECKLFSTCNGGKHQFWVGCPLDS